MVFAKVINLFGKLFSGSVVRNKKIVKKTEKYAILVGKETKRKS